MTVLFDPTAQKILNRTFVAARQERHVRISVEHLLVGLLEDKNVAQTLQACGANIDKLQALITAHIEEREQKTPLNEELVTEPTREFQRVIQRAILYSQSKGDQYVEPLHILTAVFGEKDSHAVKFLHAQGVTRRDLINYMLHGTGKSQVPAQGVIEPEVTFLNILGHAPSPLTARVQPSKPEDPKVFISYSHCDSACLDRLLVHLRPLERKNAIFLWSDKKIKPGDKWKAEIEKHLNEATIAVLMISADFLASDFIVTNELPPLLVKAETKGARIIPVILKPCGFVRDEVLSTFQAINEPSSPLLAFDHIGQERIYDQIAAEIDKEIKRRNLERDR